MCVVAVKYFDGVGWVGAKNRDRNYEPTVRIVQSNRTGVQRLYIDDLTTRYTEGLNEYGLCILSASLSVKSDEKEAEKKALPSGKREDGYMSPDGKDIRDALLLKTPKDAIKLLVERELAGSTIVFNDKECYLLEGGYTVKKQDEDDDNPRDYIHKIVKVNDYIVRTNHGVLLPELGYSSNSEDPYYKKARQSSEERLKISRKSVEECTDPEELLNAISITPNKDPFMNPIRTGNPNKGDMVTTGQIMLTPKDRTMHYRPIYSQVEFKYSKLNGSESKTYFEIVSSRKLLGFMEWHVPN